jgi:hypothetical protein
MVIDEEGNGIIPPIYSDILHNADNYFYVQSDKGWAVFNKDTLYMDYVDVEAVCDEVFIKVHLPRWIEKEQIAPAVQETMQLDTHDKVRWVLGELIKGKKRSLYDKRYTLPLKEYMALFDDIGGHKELEEAGVWMHPVKVNKLPEPYKDLIKADSHYYIGWSYPSSGGMFDMHVELPVMFTKKDGSALTLGVRVEDLVLVRG